MGWREVKYLILLFSLPLSGEVISWSASENAIGYKLYYKIVKSCNESFVEKFRYSFDAKENLSHDIRNDINFSSAEYYAFKVSAYNEFGFESEQSEAFECVKNNRPSLVEEVKKKSK